jgi:hypothetical protein
LRGIDVELHVPSDGIHAFAQGLDRAAEQIKAKSFTIDGEAVALGPDGLSRFDELSRRNAADTAILYASTSSSMTARICAISHSSTARPRWRGCYAILRLASC